ncbi:L-type lectin-domain containing receptor kinase IX.1-like protein [Trifolium pratense]|uniref:L-type lectin-domain containing receptor kinase IX.1-like protein n=1 Tax=Trifolium pratense TaxID=57577 RepID=A0A2K3P4D9_TRIPR|nr:lectin 7-like [Trifolium pratense]PNY10154.1 L-type lectin-domain containing receptor kinase IX.1-like protein [Trifolium pratense]
MAINNSSRTQILYITIISFFFLAQNVNSASFTFSDFGPYTTNIQLEGDSFISNGSIYLTGAVPTSAGRASYAGPVRLWNADNGKLAAFTSVFYFVVAPNGPGLFGDGITFFIAPFNSHIPKNSSGGFLGLVNAETALNSYQNQIVAVEFDSFGGNPWDPEFSHIGIDVNSIASLTTAPWKTGSVANGFTAFAIVNYEPLTKNLSVVVTYPETYGGTSSSTSFLIDLRNVLPEWVRVGFSGSTGQLVELHKVLSWGFKSSFY